MAGIEAFGVDGSEFIEGTPFCSRIDLSEKNAMHHIEQFKRALCVEVGEYIPRRTSPPFWTISSAMPVRMPSSCCPGPLLEGVTGHGNERPNEHVIEEMASREYEFETQLTARLRAACTLLWFKGSLMEFNEQA